MATRNSDVGPLVVLSSRDALIGAWSCTGKLSGVRFRRSADGKGWALMGVPAECLSVVASRLFLLGCKLLAPVWFASGGYYTAICFTAPNDVIAGLARAFPAPEGCEPLVLSKDGSRVLTGDVAARAYRNPRQLSV